MEYPDDYIDRIHCADCLEFMRGMPDECVDLVFADPPFNVGKAYQDNRENYCEWVAEWIGECFRVLKPTGSFYHMTLTKHLEWKMPLMAQHGVFINLITWRNVSASHGKHSFWLEYQPIMLYGKTKDYLFNTYAITDTSPLTDYAEYRKKWRWGGYSTTYRGQLKDRWDNIPFVYAGSIHHPEAIIEKGTNKKVHPCQMPEALATRAIVFSTHEGAIVLDPFVGSGTTAVSAIANNRHFIGIDNNETFCQLARSRVDLEHRQLQLF